MSDSETPTRHGRRARRLTPEEEAAQQARAASVITEDSALPAVRGAVAPPGADAPLPRLRKFGRRARIIELADPVDAPVVTESAAETAPASTAAAPQSQESDDPWKSADAAQVVDPDPAHADGAAPAEAATSAPSTDRDSDGVELGELSVAEAPDPRPAPRFEGRVLQRSENSGGRALLWLVWLLIGLAVVALIVLLATGILGPGSAGALGAVTAPTTFGPLADACSAPFPTPLEVTFA